jgi:nitrite reductase/ring-hydroxylating ferredoxin subunit
MNKIGKLDRNSFEVESIKISLNDLSAGVNDYNEFIIKYIDGKVVYIIDKICDHAGGRLVLKSGKAICPMHSWILDLDSLTYEGSKNIKKSLDYDVKINHDLTKQDGAPIKVLGKNNFVVYFPNFIFTNYNEGIDNTIKYYKKIL